MVTEEDYVYLPEVLFEFHRRGKFVKVSAIDPRTNTEVSMVGSPRYGQVLLKRLALRKLAYVIAKRKRGGAPRRRDRKERGILV